MYRIMIIEDDQPMADAMQKQIEAWGNQCQCVTDFRNVIPAFASYDPHLVLMDIMLPFFNGASLSAAMGESGLLPAGACRLLEIGQRGGTADAAMDKIARDLSEDGEAALEELVSRVEPSLVLVCSILVGVILLSVMLPLMHIMSAIG